jgi:hypothetical protein
LDLGAESGLTGLRVETKGFLASGTSRSGGKSPREEGSLRLQLRLGVALHAEVCPSALGVSDGGTNELAVPLAFLGASRPGELQRTSTSCLSLVGGGAILLKAEGASGLLGSASGFPGLGVASASRVLGGAAAPNVNSVGVLGTVLHKVVSPAGRAERGGRASVSQEKRLQYRRQGAASRRSPPGSSRASKLVDERKKGEMVKLRRIIESVYAVPKCNSKTVIPENQSTGCAAEGCTEHDARNWKTPEPSKQPQTATARLRSRGIKAQTAPRGNYRTWRKIMMPKVQATNELHIPHGKATTGD